MSALVLMIGFSLAVALLFLAAFLWALRAQQYRDTCTPAIRMLFDDATAAHPDSGEKETP